MNFYKLLAEAKKKKMDAVDKDELEGSHDEREDGDIDNDGDEDSSDEYLHNRRKAISKAIGKVKEEVEELDEAAVVTHKWYSMKNWKDGSDHFDNLDDHLRGHTPKHAATGNTSRSRPDHHIGIPVKAKSAISYMDKHAKPVNEEAEELDEAPTAQQRALTKASEKAQPKDKVSLKKAPWEKKNEEVEELDEISPELAKRAFDARAKKHAKASASAKQWDRQADKDSAKGDNRGASAAYSIARDKEDKANRMASKLDRSAKKAGVDGQKRYAKVTETRSPTQKYVEELDEGKKGVVLGFKDQYKSRNGAEDDGRRAMKKYGGASFSVYKSSNGLWAYKVFEEAEQIDEVSKAKLQRYVKAADKDLDNLDRPLQRHKLGMDDHMPAAHGKKLERDDKNRKKGLSLARKKLRNEEAEELDEATIPNGQTAFTKPKVSKGDMDKVGEIQAMMAKEKEEKAKKMKEEAEDLVAQLAKHITNNPKY